MYRNTTHFESACICGRSWCSWQSFRCLRWKVQWQIVLIWQEPQWGFECKRKAKLEAGPPPPHIRIWCLRYCYCRKYTSDILSTHTQVKCVFEQKCRNVDIASNCFCETLSHLPICASQESLIKSSLPYDNFSVEAKYKGSRLWNAIWNHFYTGKPIITT
jgi:hypothetical protein